MTQTIPATAAGRFYPSDPAQLRREIRDYVAAANVDCLPKAIIAPHAAYGYCGRIMGYAYRAVQSARDRYQRVVLLGTCHVRGVFGLASTAAATFDTPLGEVVVDRSLVDYAADFLAGESTIDDVAHAADHSLQTQLPFLQVVLGEFTVAPFLASSIASRRVGELLTALGGLPDTLIVVSSDLSHYLDYDACVRVDRETINAIVALDASSIGPEQACGYAAIGGLLHAARRLDWTAALLALQNSGDVAGSRSRVVGYGAIAMEGPQE